MQINLGDIVRVSKTKQQAEQEGGGRVVGALKGLVAANLWLARWKFKE